MWVFAVGVAAAEPTAVPPNEVTRNAAHRSSGTCIKGEPPLPAGYQVASQATGDFDDDGRPDRFELILPPTNEQPASEHSWGIRPGARVVFARGISTSIQELDEAERVIGVVDLDEDGRDEVFIKTGAITVSNAQILAVDDCRVEPVVQADGSPYWFSYDGHSNCCPASGMGFLCPKRDKGRVLIEVDYAPEIGKVDKSDWEAVGKALASPNLSFRWHRRMLRLKGPNVVIVSEETGHSHANDSTVPMINRFSCGGEDPKPDPR